MPVIQSAGDGGSATCCGAEYINRPLELQELLSSCDKFCDSITVRFPERLRDLEIDEVLNGIRCRKTLVAANIRTA